MIPFAVIGIDHRHCYTMAAHIQSAGGRLVGWATDGEPGTLDGWVRRFPDAPRRAAADLLTDPEVALILTAAVPCDRPGIAVAALEAGKHVLSDKPGALSRAQLDEIRAACTRADRHWAVDFSERFEVPGVTRADALVRDGAIGEVLDVTLLAPHRLNAATRPDWFWDRGRNGGILADIGSHQIDQVLHFAGTDEAQIVLAEADCLLRPPFQDRGRIALRAGRATGTILLNWFTPDGLPTWGDGRLFLTGTRGTIELRKYVDPAGQPGTDHVILVNDAPPERIDAAGDPLPFFSAFLCGLDGPLGPHPFKVTELAIRAQEMAEC
ncbi:Gfo/Idh/MocA family protein [Jannaschia aquimarina]|uniref:YvaA protein n=1 Tax=Jannaschia aquimarina TaxID=935700 RepID=A0A0D1CKF8_9RHOB|nr:Gfo/Idh/MocA family oxidoreductase [Jannaschia aquimarina]KIT15232.1 putative oxidoreductase YvaA [Jannaschia aquimarina]SNT32565.1 Predicted dehydrogenase [Jannaschia aquimarina]